MKGQAKLSARLGGQVVLAGYSQHPPRALSHSHQLVFPVLGCVDDVAQDGPMDHLSISLAPFSSIKSSGRVGVGGGRKGGGGPLKGLHRPSLFTAPRGEREEGGWTEGWIGMPVEEGKK